MLITTRKTEHLIPGLFDSWRTGTEGPGGEARTPTWAKPGLSLAHTSTQDKILPPQDVGKYRITNAKGGSCCRITQIAFPKPYRTLPIDGSPGRKIRGFSRTARSRMLETLNSINQEKIKATHFFSLTVKRDSLDWSGIERVRRIWIERFRRKWGDDNASIIWKKEPHKSGTPHLHMLITWLKWSPDITMMREWNDAAWCESVISAGGHAAPAGQRVELMRLWKGVQSYCSKYCAKLIEDDSGIPVETGKIWGVTFRANLPIERNTSYHEKLTGIKVKRALRKLHQRRAERYEARLKDETGAEKWWQLRPYKHKILGDVSVEYQLEMIRRQGSKIRKIRPKCMRTERVPIWLECENGKMVNDGEELHTFCSSLHFVSDETISRLVKVTEANIAHEKMLDSRIPF